MAGSWPCRDREMGQRKACLLEEELGTNSQEEIILKYLRISKKPRGAGAVG